MESNEYFPVRQRPLKQMFTTDFPAYDGKTEHCTTPVYDDVNLVLEGTVGKTNKQSNCSHIVFPYYETQKRAIFGIYNKE